MYYLVYVMEKMSSSYIDKITYFEEVHETAYRNGVIEYNTSSQKILGVRIYRGGCLVVRSSNKVSNHNDLLRDLGTKDTVCIDTLPWYDKEYYNGRVSFGKPSEQKELDNLVRDIAKTLSSLGLAVEVIGVSRKTRLEIESITTGSTGIEERYFYELYIYPYTMYMGRLLSTGFFYAGESLRDLYDRTRHVVDDIKTLFASILKARRLNPAYTGKWLVVLTGEASPAFYHELAHLLQGDEPIKLRKGFTLTQELTMYEDPFYPGPLKHLFDDELYPSWRRKLVEKGVVVDYLHTRTTCGTGSESKPGNARGLFTRSKPLHHQLIVAHGTWSFDEMLMESRRSIVVPKIIKAEITGDYIKITPEITWVAEKDKLSPVKISEIAVPISRLNEVIIGLGKKSSERVSYEKNMLVYEVAPETLLEARVS